MGARATAGAPVATLASDCTVRCGDCVLAVASQKPISFEAQESKLLRWFRKAVQVQEFLAISEAIRRITVQMNTLNRTTVKSHPLKLVDSYDPVI